MTFKDQVLAIRSLDIVDRGEWGFSIETNSFGLTMQYGWGPTEDEAWECALYNLTHPYDPNTTFWLTTEPEWKRR